MTPDQIETYLDLWPGLEGGKATLINLSENHTFRVGTPDEKHHILRVHRPDYQSQDAIESELIWLQALARDTKLPVIKPRSGRNGKLVQLLDRNDVAPRHAVSFAFEQGAEPESAFLPHLFSDLGRFAAICHTHVQNWQPPIGFTRPTWNAGAILDADGLWGNWRTAPHVTGEVRDILDRLDQALRVDLDHYGSGPDRFGLIHADMRLANVLVHKGKTRLIDFDDCGFGWFAYDFAAAVSFFEDSPEVPEFKAIWLEAYRKVRKFSPEDEGAIDATILLRRMALLAWIGSHSETELAQSHAKDFAHNSAKLAEAYLSASI